MPGSGTFPRPPSPSGPLSDGPVRDWFDRTFPDGPTPAQRAAWPAIASGAHLLLIAPTGTGKTLAAFLAILHQLVREHQNRTLTPAPRGVYVSPLRSLGYDIERHLNQPLDAIRTDLGLTRSPVSVAVRTGDTSAYRRRRLRDAPPHLLITTPESLSLLLSQRAWHDTWKSTQYLIIDEIHALVPTKRGADLAVSLERLAAKAAADPIRVGLSATCRPSEPVARFLVGPSRSCRVVDASPDLASSRKLSVESLLEPDESPHRGLSYRRLLRRLGRAVAENRTTVVFANTRALTERITHDLRATLDGDRDSETEIVAAHHSALDAHRRRAVESALKTGTLRAVVTSTSLELGVDLGTADLTVQVGLPGRVSRCVQRVGRSGHRPGAVARGVILASTPSELIGAAVTARAAENGDVEPLRPIRNPLDVLCQQLIGMACGDEWSSDEAFALVRRADPMAGLSRADFEACLAFLAGELPAPAGAFEPEPGASPRWTSPRLWRHRGRFGLRSRRVLRWFRQNVGTITSEDTVRVLADGQALGTVEAAYAERLQHGDRFVLDGRCLEFLRLDGLVVNARLADGEPSLPRWTSDRQGLSAELAEAVARFRSEAARLLAEGPSALRAWLGDVYGLEPQASAVMESFIEAQERCSEVPRPDLLLVEETPAPEGTRFSYAFHAPLGRSACEALGRAIAAKLGRRFGRDLGLSIADLGWAIRIPEEGRLSHQDVLDLLTPENFAADVLEGLDRGELPARRFRHVAATALMVLRCPEGKRTRVGGLLWVSQRLYPLVQATCPDHPLLRETRREVLEEVLDVPGALAWLSRRPPVRLRVLDRPSPFASAWLDPAAAEAVRFETPEEVLKRLHARIMAT